MSLNESQDDDCSTERPEARTWDSVNEDQTATTIGLTPHARVEAIDRLARDLLAHAQHDDLEDNTATRLREQALEIRAEVETTREILSNGDGMEIRRGVGSTTMLGP